MEKLNQTCELCSTQAPQPHYRRLLPLFYVFALIIFLSTIRQFLNGLDPMLWMMDFMGIFFLTFGLFKLYDLQGFTEGFKTYDTIAKRIPLFGYAYPFIEIVLGVMYLAGFMFLWQNLTAVLLALFGMYSSFIAIKNKDEIQCVCLGTAFNLPMTSVTLAENGVMFVMALFMIFM